MTWLSAGVCMYIRNPSETNSFSSGALYAQRIFPGFFTMTDARRSGLVDEISGEIPDGIVLLLYVRRDFGR